MTDTIEIKSLKKCALCGMCKANCPIYKVTLQERHSPRGKSMLLKEDKLSAVFYTCTLCGACKVSCPAQVDLELRKQRTRLVKKGVETQSNKKMIENIRWYGNPFGKSSEIRESKEEER